MSESISDEEVLKLIDEFCTPAFIDELLQILIQYSQPCEPLIVETNDVY
jgi:hypothetical protein